MSINRIINILYLMLTGAVCHAAPVAEAVEVFVSTHGNDADRGTESRPVATIGRALEIVRHHCGKRPVTIFLREGKYRIAEPIVIDAGYSGSEECPLTITSYPDEKVTVSSAAEIDCDWRDYRDGIICTTVADAGDLRFDRLFVGGQAKPMARYPDRNPDISILEGYAPDAIAPERVARWRNPAGGYVHAMHSAEWGGYQYHIDGKNDDGSLKLSAGFQNNRMAGMHPTYRMVENIFEELDAPGEWYFDHTSSQLYYYPETGCDMASVTVETPRSETLFVIRGESGSPARYINIKGLELAETERTFMKTSEPLLRSDWKIYRGGAVMFENAEHCSLSYCHLHDIGGNAVFMSGYNRRNSVTRNHIERVGASAVCFVGKPEAVRSPLFEYRQRHDWDSVDKTPGPCGDDYPAYCDVTDNLIHSIGETEKQGAGIQISMAMGITVSHNSIYRLPRAGINVSEGTWGGHVIEWNDVFDTVLETGDHGSFNSWGRDRYWYPRRREMDSIVALNPDAPYLDAIHTTIIRNNRWRCDHGWDIDLDDGSSNYHIYNNLCLNGGLKLREGFARKVENNVMVNNSFHPHVWFAASGDEFRHNIVTTAYRPIGINHWGREIDRNFFASQAGLDLARKAGTDARSLAGDPMFVDPASGDYRVADGSGALEVGFINFPMDRFGVEYAPLRAIAATPELPVSMIVAEAGVADDGHSFEWHGISFKTVMTEGERSAAGLPSVKGVMVTASNNAGIDLRANDVILELNGVATDNAAMLRKQLDKIRDSEVVAVTFRDQKAQNITIGRAAGGH